MDYIPLLIAKDGLLEGKKFQIYEGDGILIGRSPECEVQLDAEGVSRIHARVHFSQKGIWVKDEDSHNGVFVNGKKIESSGEIRPGRLMTIGNQSFTVELVEPENFFTTYVKAMLLLLQTLPVHQKKYIRFTFILLEALFFTLLSLLIIGALGIKEAGFFGLFFTAATLMPRFQALLQENKDNIFVHQNSASYANGMTAFSILMQFLGICVAYFVTSIFYTEAELAGYFGFVFDLTNTNSGHLLNRKFSNFISIFKHNLTVLGVTALLSLIYRSYAALLILGWNATIWVIVLVTLARRGLEASGMAPLTFYLGAGAAVLPHLILEGSAYIIASLAAIFYSKGLTKYNLSMTALKPKSEASFMALKIPKNDVFNAIVMTCFKMILFALGVLLLAAVVESFYAPWVLSMLK